MLRLSFAKERRAHIIATVKQARSRYRLRNRIANPNVARRMEVSTLHKNSKEKGISNDQMNP